MSKIEAVTLTHPGAKTWDEIGLDSHIKRLGVCLVIYLLTLGIFWYAVVTGGPENLQLRLLFMFFAACNFIFLTVTAYKIQVGLKENGFQKHGGWHVVVGSLFLNPFFIGWYISLSVLIKALLTRRRVKMAER
ncbi:MAG: hypothetical protein V4495_04710 [Pseudomonadota bacterium]